jgi:hypothetical protein
MTLSELKALIDRTNDVMEPADVDLGDMSDQSRTYLEYLENEVCQYRTAIPNALALIEVMAVSLERIEATCKNATDEVTEPITGLHIADICRQTLAAYEQFKQKVD